MTQSLIGYPMFYSTAANQENGARGQDFNLPWEHCRLSMVTRAPPNHHSPYWGSNAFRPSRSSDLQQSLDGPHIAKQSSHPPHDKSAGTVKRFLVEWHTGRLPGRCRGLDLQGDMVEEAAGTNGKVPSMSVTIS